MSDAPPPRSTGTRDPFTVGGPGDPRDAVDAPDAPGTGAPGTGAPGTSVGDPLTPLEDALLARARATADALLAEAWEEAARVRQEAQDEAAAVATDARARGEEDARAVLAFERSQARRAARDVVLRAQRDAHESLRRAATDAVRTMLEDPGAHAALVDLVLHRLGPGGTVTDHPDGGVVGTDPGGRTVDASVPALVASALADLDLEQLWSPA